jgi:hypothetical protein
VEVPSWWPSRLRASSRVLAAMAVSAVISVRSSQMRSSTVHVAWARVEQSAVLQNAHILIEWGAQRARNWWQFWK